MHKVLRPLKDTYITDRVIRGTRKWNANVGRAGTLDIFKLYGATLTGSVPNNELSRVLLHFDLSDLEDAVDAGRINIASPTFNVTLKLFDVYGGQPNPTNFVLKLYALSRSFDEGGGKDVVFFRDSDISNFLTSSYVEGTESVWFASGANAKGLLGSADIDVIASGNLGDGLGVRNLWVTQSFVAGTENLEMDITTLVSATLAGLIPDYGFRVSYTENDENDLQTRFVKRFGSSEATNPYVRPQLVVKFDDSVVSHESSFFFDTENTLFLYNYVKGNLTNVVSGTALTQITGSNSLLLKLVTRISESTGFEDYISYVTASQHRIGTTNVVGVYSASFTLKSATTQYQTKLRQSGSILFDQVWGSFDGNVAYFTGSLTGNPPAASTGPTNPKRYYVNVTNISNEYADDDMARIKVFFFDYSSPVVKLVRVPVETPSVIVENAHFAVRDVITNDIPIPFDTTYNSTRMSADSQTMYFDLDMTSLFPGRSYVIDVMVNEGGQQQIYRDVSPAFRVVEL
jgi:hypothetical protein